MKGIKRIISGLLVVCLFFSILPVQATAEGSYSGTIGENLSWSLGTDGTLLISGSGDISFSHAEDSPWNEYCRYITTIIVEEGITGIGDHSFCDCQFLKVLFIPKSVKKIDNDAFLNCWYPDDVYYGGSKEDWNNIITNKEPFFANATFHYSSTSLETEIPAGGKCGENAIWYLDEDGTLTISGGGLMHDFSLVVDICPWFRYRTLIKKAIIQEGISYIGARAFYWCENLENVDIYDSVTAIGPWAFHCCHSLIEVTIPDSVTEIETQAFAACKKLNTVNLPHALSTIGYGLFESSNNLIGITIPEGVTLIERQAFMDCGSLNSITIPYSVNTIQKLAFDRCNALKDVYYNGSEEEWNQIVIEEGNECLKNARIHFNSTGPDNRIVKDYLDNESITINNAGSACAYYIGPANKIIHYSINGNKETTSSDEKGVFKIPLGYFDTVGTYPIGIEIAQIEDTKLDSGVELNALVNVMPLSFTEEWELSFDSSVGANIGAGTEIEMGAVEAKATLGNISVEGSIGNSIKMSRSYDAEGETITITRNQNVGTGLGLSSGITGEVLNSEMSLIDASVGVDTHLGVIDGLEITNYSSDNIKQNRALAAYLLGEALATAPSNFIYKKVYDYLIAQKVYSDADCIVIDGCSSSVSGNIGFGAGKITYDDKDLFSIATGETNVTLSATKQKTTSGVIEKEMSYTSEIGLCHLIPDSFLVTSSLIAANFLSEEISITAKNSETERLIEVTSLKTPTSGGHIYLFGKRTSSEYQHYIYKGKALNKLLKKESSFDSYLNGNTDLLSLEEMAKLASSIATCDEPIEYSNELKSQGIFSVPFNVGAKLGLGLDFGVDFSYISESSYSSASGYVINDELRLSSESVDLSSYVLPKFWDISTVFTNILGTLASDVKELFTTITVSIKEGMTGIAENLQDIWAWVSANTDSPFDWDVTIIYLNKNIDFDSEIVSLEHHISTFNRRFNNGGQEKLEFANGNTVSTPVVINVKDTNTKKEIIDFSDEPLEITIRFSVDTLLSAGLSVDSDIIKNGGIAMYRYSDEGDYFEYIGGSVDFESMTVTAMITKPGQYVLAVEIPVDEDKDDDENGDNMDSEQPSKVTRVAGGSRYSTCIAVADELKATLGGEDFSSVVVASGADFPDALAGTYLASVKKAPILLIADTHINMMVEYIDKNMTDSGTIYILGSENSVSKKAADALSTVGNVKRLGGKSRFITNLRILEEVDTKTGELLVVYSVAPWDALSVSSSGRPILLVNDKLRDDQKQYLETTSFDKITMIGSTAGVSETVETELSAYCSNMDRVYGKNRFMTSIAVADYFYGPNNSSIVVACGTNFPDGLCSGALAHAKKAPVILTDAGRESLVADYVTGHNVQSGYVIGSTKVVSDDSVRKAFNMTAEDIIK